MLSSVEIPTLPCQAPKVLFCTPLFLVLYVLAPLSQKAQPGEAVLPKYDLHIETKTVIKSGDDRLHVYVRPKPQEEMGISFSKRDEVVVTGSKVKQDASDVMLARELLKGMDTLSFHDGKGNPVWYPHTGQSAKMEGFDETFRHD